jgi:hypothetical protein
MACIALHWTIQGDMEVCEKCKNAIVLGGFIGLDEKKEYI